MVSASTLLKFILGVKDIVIDRWECTNTKTGTAVLHIWLHPMAKAKNRCPVCGRKCPVYDGSETMRSWRALDLNGTLVYLHAPSVRVCCPEHGVHETSYRKGHKYITVVVNHDTNEVIWAHERHGKEVFEMFLKELTEEQRASIEIVTGDGARWIDECIKQYLPRCKRCVDGFHVVEWANEALDKVRRKSWRDAVEESRRVTKLAHEMIEATNNKIKLIIRRSYGFRNIQNMIDMVLLICSNLRVPLPNRPETASQVR